MDHVNKLILEKENVFIYHIPLECIQNPKFLNRASNWDLSHPVKLCKLILTAIGPSCHAQLYDDFGNVFGQSVIHWYPGINRRSSSLNRVVDSSRYFILEVENNSGEYYFLGVGFSGRKDSLDLTTALKNYFATRYNIWKEVTVNVSKHNLEQELAKNRNICTIKAPQKCEKEKDSYTVTNCSEKPALSLLRIPPEQEKTVNDGLQKCYLMEVKLELQKIQQESFDGDPNCISEKGLLEQNSNERNVVEYSKFEQQLAETCLISVAQACKINQNIFKVLEIHRKERLKKLDPLQSADGLFCGFCYLLPGKIYQCHLCPANFRNSIPGSPMPLISHWNKVHGSKILHCLNCSLVFSNETEFSLHMKLVHGYSCFVCGEFIGKMRNVRRHLLNLHKPALLELLEKQKPTKADVTELTKNFGSNNDPSTNTLHSDHRAVKKSDPEEVSDNDEVERILHRSVEKLIERHRLKNLKQIDTDPCHPKDKTSGGFCYRHPDKGFQCHLCPARFPCSSCESILPLSRHWKKVHGNSFLNCVKCDLVFSTNAQYALHKKLVHDFDCIFCIASINKERTFRRHLLKYHKQALLDFEIAEKSAIQIELVANQEQ